MTAPARFSSRATLRLPQDDPAPLKNDAMWRLFVASLYKYAAEVGDALNAVGKESHDGTWTPTDGSGASLSFTSPTGTVKKHGRMVVATASLQYPPTASGANAVISGLPYTIGSLNSIALCYTTDATVTLAFGVAAQTNVLLLAAGGGAARTNANLSGNNLAFTLVYESAT